MGPRPAGLLLLLHGHPGAAQALQSLPPYCCPRLGRLCFYFEQMGNSKSCQVFRFTSCMFLKFQRLIPMNMKRPRMTARWGERMKRRRMEEAKATMEVTRRRQSKTSFNLLIQSILIFSEPSASASMRKYCPSESILFSEYLVEFENCTRKPFLMFNLFGCCSRNVLRKAGRPYLSERKNWGALDGASWCRHDPAIPYQVLTPQLGSGNLLGFGLRGSGPTAFASSGHAPTICP